MCDTLVALKNSTKNGSVIFGKNSDREKDEPHVIIRVPRKKHEKGEKVKCTYIEIPQTEETYDCILFKPSWMYGAEMGVNEFGVVIGNEAVFTKEKQGPPALLGMDILRLALERSKSSLEAVEHIIYCIKTYGQGGKCGYTKNLRYHNSFIVADFKSAYKLETAGKVWALKKIEDYDSISNTISITDDYDMLSSDVLEEGFVYTKILNRKNFDFKARYENKIIAKVAMGDFRRNRTRSLLKEKKGELTVIDFMNILRHHEKDGCNPFNGSMRNVCMHQKSIISSETTGSMIVELKEGQINIWATGTSLPCLSSYKPLWFVDSDVFIYEHDLNKAVDYWKIQREIIKEVEDGKKDKKKYLEKIDEFEKMLISKASEAKTDEDKKEIMNFAWR
ncbi:Peptidase family C69 [Caloramator mitchellensis]|uniref:Peptidase family C69 n=1 Tax=Caloramator mitchellensis TaxID=908809 RepID=A0A0R3K3K8_CALMK|nr:C69 family dipeptidase [Caloramator mitchellensis]KRQ86911.1 Peptidase family C69 [Caloramator mitchellensis]